MRIARETEVLWTPIVGNSYQAQWSPTLVDAVWTDLGSSLAGSGSSQSAYDTSMARVYRVMETVPASDSVVVAANAITINPGFESGATGWTLVGSVHSVQASNARTGLSALRSLISTGGVGAQLTKEVPAIVPGKVYTLSFWANLISADPSYVQMYKLEWVNANNSVTVATGNWVNFSGELAPTRKFPLRRSPPRRTPSRRGLCFTSPLGRCSGPTGQFGSMTWLSITRPLPPPRPRRRGRFLPRPAL